MIFVLDYLFCSILSGKDKQIRYFLALNVEMIWKEERNITIIYK